jgi:hypothetical protein
MQPPSALHGAGHTARVMVWAAVLTRGTEWFEPVVWAAACHDLRRVNDGDDLPHGFRAGGWVRQVLPGKLRQPLPCLELIASACDWHVCADEDAEWDHPVLWWLKDADGLDRVRLFDLDPRYLRHAETHPWVPAATRLYQATSDLQDAPLIWEKAGALDIPVRELIAFVREQVETRLKPEPEAPKTPVRPARGW